MEHKTRQGVTFALTAYGLWAVAPIYFKWVEQVNPLDILAHRVIWSFVLTLVIVLLSKRLKILFSVIRSARLLTFLFLSTLLIAANWGIFIWAINSDQMLSASLGYYINPLINILLGMLFFAERLRRAQKLAAILCVIAVLFEIWHFGRLPWIAIILATTFALYGLVRKKLAVDSFIGMVLETGLLIPFALIMLNIPISSISLPAHDWSTTFKLMLAGPVTMIPLLCFAAAANRISLTALGFFQYIGPSGMFLLAVFVYDESFSPAKLVTFGIIWTALALLVWDSLQHRPPAFPQEPTRTV
ncbi:EamA family transporter RarD [Reinekea sp. G2M2-21]|uniref:EamA family transporter RarD n=1 Tax=Reinekea sp. G2M2-21 TaxID=2788942 RepID=UPI0018AAE96D